MIQQKKLSNYLLLSINFVLRVPEYKRLELACTRSTCPKRSSRFGVRNMCLKKMQHLYLSEIDR